MLPDLQKEITRRRASPRPSWRSCSCYR